MNFEKDNNYIYKGLELWPSDSHTCANIEIIWKNLACLFQFSLSSILFIKTEKKTMNLKKNAYLNFILFYFYIFHFYNYIYSTFLR